MDFSLKTCSPTVLAAAGALPKLLNDSEAAASLVNMGRLNEVLAALAKHHHQESESQNVQQTSFTFLGNEGLPHLQFNPQLLALQNLRPLSDLSSLLQQQQQQSIAPTIRAVQPSYLPAQSLMTPPSLVDVLNLNNSPAAEGGSGSSSAMSSLLHQLMATATPTVHLSPPAKRAKPDCNNNDLYPMPPPLPSPPPNCSSVHSSSCVSSTQSSPVHSHTSKSQLVRRLSAHSNNTCTSTSSVSNKTPQRKPAAPIPAEKKDAAYFERRRKNNDAAKRSRDSRRKKEELTASRAESLERENMLLRKQLDAVKEELRVVKFHVTLQSRKLNQPSERTETPSNLCTATALLLLNNNCGDLHESASFEQVPILKVEGEKTISNSEPIVTAQEDKNILRMKEAASPPPTNLDEF